MSRMKSQAPEPPTARKRWINRTVLGIGLASLFSVWDKRGGWLQRGVVCGGSGLGCAAEACLPG